MPPTGCDQQPKLSQPRSLGQDGSLLVLRTATPPPHDASVCPLDNGGLRGVSLSGPGLTVSFQYDAVGRRKQKTVNSTTTECLYDGLNPVQELSGGSVVANLLTSLGIDEVWSRTEATGSRSFLADGLGSTLALTDNTGTVQTEYMYEPFGNTTVNGTSSTNAFQYTGRENDGIGLYYYRARYYHPVLQRFISEDPIGFLGGDVNLYAFVYHLHRDSCYHTTVPCPEC